MKKEEKCISLSLAKELQQVAKEKGFELPKSEWWWDIKNDILTNNRAREDKINDYIPAYDTSELGEILPRNIKIKCGICTVKEWRVILFEKNLDEKSKDFMKEKTIKITDGLTEAEARGKLLLYLIKNDIIK